MSAKLGASTAQIMSVFGVIGNISIGYKSLNKTNMMEIFTTVTFVEIQLIYNS